VASGAHSLSPTEPMQGLLRARTDNASRTATGRLGC